MPEQMRQKPGIKQREFEDEAVALNLGRNKAREFLKVGVFDWAQGDAFVSWSTDVTCKAAAWRVKA